MTLRKGGVREVARPEREYRIKGRVVVWNSSYVGICDEASEFFSAWVRAQYAVDRSDACGCTGELSVDCTSCKWN